MYVYIYLQNPRSTHGWCVEPGELEGEKTDTHPPHCRGLGSGLHGGLQGKGNSHASVHRRSKRMKKRMKRMKKKKTYWSQLQTLNFEKNITLIKVYVIKMCVCSWENLVPKYEKIACNVLCICCKMFAEDFSKEINKFKCHWLHKVTSILSI